MIYFFRNNYWNLIKKKCNKKINVTSRKSNISCATNRIATLGLSIAFINGQEQTSGRRAEKASNAGGEIFHLKSTLVTRPWCIRVSVVDLTWAVCSCLVKHGWSGSRRALPGLWASVHTTRADKHTYDSTRVRSYWYTRGRTPGDSELHRWFM